MKSSQKTTSTTNPLAPGYVKTGLESLTGKVMDFASMDPYSLVAPYNPAQETAIARQSSLSGSPWNFDAAADITRGVANMGTPEVQSASLLDGLQSYVNPMLSGVVDATKADLDANDGRVRAAQDLAIARDGAFGGSGTAITKSLTEGELGRARGSILGGLRSDAYDKAYGYSSQDAQRRQDASSQNAQLELARRQQALSSAGQLGNLSALLNQIQTGNNATLFDMGSTLQGIDQAEAQAPASLLGTATGAFGSLPFDLVTGQQSTGKTTSNSGLGGLLGGLGTLGFGLGALGFSPFGGK